MMRSAAMAWALVLLLAACGQPAAGPIRASSMRAHLVDEPDKTPVAGSVSPDPRVGAVFLGGGNSHTCTGSVVHSYRGDLILTAAHCLFKGFTTTFVPGFADTAAPSAVWTIDAVYLDPLWVARQDPRVDYAFARVSRPGGGSIEAQVGSALTLGTAPAPGDQVSIIGYAAGVGGAPIGCQARTEITADGFPSFRCAGLVDGTSGAPWIAASAVTGVTGGLEGGGCTPSLSYSAPFDERTAALLARAEAGGPGEVAPSASLGC
jgi:Trypsin